MLFGASKLITEYLKEGDLYSEVRKVYSINILYFDLGQGADYIYKGRTIFKGLHANDELQLSINQKARFKQEVPADLYPEYFILKINTFDKVAKSSLDEWIYYLKNGELPQPYRAKGLKEVEKKLKVEKMEPTAKKQYQKYVEDMRISRSALETARYEGRSEGEIQGIEKGREEGKEERTRQIVLNCFKQGSSLEFISSITGLTVEEVESILKEA
jgi:predicted transposase/invertase (TIGR01784 family)